LKGEVKMINNDYHIIAGKITLEDYDTLLYMIGMDTSSRTFVKFIVEKDEYIIKSTDDNINEFQRLLNNGLVKMKWINEDQVCFKITSIGLKLIANRERCDVKYN
jgi:uncharacterized surface protein with fasciclin (FAS1) repeats